MSSPVFNLAPVQKKKKRSSSKKNAPSAPQGVIREISESNVDNPKIAENFDLKHELETLKLLQDTGLASGVLINSRLMAVQRAAAAFSDDSSRVELERKYGFGTQ